MINTKKSAFTLVELIVVITILAILATIAFISFQGSTSDAKNVKVKSDVANLAKKVSIVNAQGTTFKDMATATGAANKITGTLAIADSTANVYEVGKVDFGKIQEDAAAFKDKASTPHDYIYAYAGTGSYSYYQVGGELVDANGAKTALIKGNYAETVTADADSLISNATATADGIKSGATSVLY